MKTRVDLFIKNGLVLAHAALDARPKSSLAIKNGLILDIGPTESLSQQYEAPIEIDAQNCLVMPGLVNTHTHIPMSCYRGLADDLPLMEWLHKSIFPAEAKTTRDQVYWSSLLSCAEMIRSGTTAFCDMYLFEEEVAKATDKAGLRALLGEGLFGFPSTSYGPIDQGIAWTKRLIEEYRNHPRIHFAVMPHAPYTCPPQLLELSARIARENKVPLAIHLAETEAEDQEIRSKHGMSPVELLDHLGFLGPDVIAAHCVWLSEHDKELLVKHKVKVAYNPESNMKLGSGVAPIADLLARGIQVGLGTDGSASNNDQDLFAEMDMAAKLQKVHRKDPTQLTAHQVLHMATLGGAEVLGLGSQIGTLEPGKFADIIILEMDKPHWHPLYSLPSQIVYSAKGPDVRDTIVQGKLLMQDRKILVFDESEVFSHIQGIRAKVLEDTGRILG